MGPMAAIPIKRGAKGRTAASPNHHSTSNTAPCDKTSHAQQTSVLVRPRLAPRVSPARGRRQRRAALATDKHGGRDHP